MDLDEVVRKAIEKIDSLTVDELEQALNKYGYYPERKDNQE